MRIALLNENQKKTSLSILESEVKEFRLQFMRLSVFCLFSAEQAVCTHAYMHLVCVFLLMLLRL